MRSVSHRLARIHAVLCLADDHVAYIDGRMVLADDPMVRYDFKRRTLLRQAESRSTLADQTYLAGPRQYRICNVNLPWVILTMR